MLNHSAGFNVCPTKMFQGHNPQILLHEANTIVSQTVDRLLLQKPYSCPNVVFKFYLNKQSETLGCTTNRDVQLFTTLRYLKI